MQRSETLKVLAGNTPASRDRYVDLLRAFSIAVVVFGHWLMAVIYMRDGSFGGANALDVVPGLWIATWLLQVMPLFFMVGGFSNFVGWKSVRERGEGYGHYLRTRTARLMRPTFVFIAAWTAIATTVRFVDRDLYSSISFATEILAKPLWFLAVYILVVALAPAMVRLHERFGARVLLALGGAAVVVDFVRIAGDIEAVGYLNFAFVWLFAHQLGFHYAEQRVTHLPRRIFVATAVASLGALALLTGTGIYSPSMVGMASESASNNSPPSICLILMSTWLASAALLARPAVSRWLQRPRVWIGVIAANSVIMTVFLWHLTAMFVGVLLLFPIGFPQPAGGSALWWVWRPVWLMALGAILAGLVALLGRFERPKREAGSSVALSRLAFGGATVALIAGLAGLAEFGFAQPTESLASPLALPAFNAGLVFVGYRALVARHQTGG